MVERRPDPTDRRCWRLHLTDAARPLLGEIDLQLSEVADIICQDIGEDSLAAAAAALHQMRDRAQELRAANPPEPSGSEAEPDIACAASG